METESTITTSTDRYKYLRVNENGRLSEWTGTFESRYLALKWFNKWGEFWKSRGHNLKLISIRERRAERIRDIAQLMTMVNKKGKEAKRLKKLMEEEE